MYTLMIKNGDNKYYPIVKDKVKWETSRKSTPSKLTFTVIADKNLKISEGNLVKFKWDKKNVFYGYIFTIENSNDEELNITCYDQLRYFKNKDAIMYVAKTATQVLNILANKFQLRIGECEDTKYTLSRNEDNATLFDIMLNAMDETLLATGKLYVLWDDYGKLRIANIESNVLEDIVLDKDLGEKFTYKTTIDSNTYNQVKLAFDNKETGTREYYIAKDSKTQDRWGVLQYYNKEQTITGIKEKAEKMLKYYDAKGKNFQLKNFKGDVRCRAGFSPVIKMKIRGNKFSNYMLIEKATHTFSENEHLMDLELSGKYVFE